MNSGNCVEVMTVIVEEQYQSDKTLIIITPIHLILTEGRWKLNTMKAVN